MLIVWGVICALYALLIIALLYGFSKVKTYKPSKKIEAIGFSIIIPFKNEAEHLPLVLTALKQLDYPRGLWEVLLVNDNSTDTSEKVVTDFMSANPEYNIHMLHSMGASGSPKKDAITLAISQAHFDWVVTTDGDCLVPKKWLETLSGFITKQQPKMVAMPVTYVVNNTFLDKFQLIDFLSLMGSTIGGFGLKKPFMCNGANLAYEKSTFYKVKGFEGNNHISSGDDIFMMEKIAHKYPEGVHYLKSEKAIVTTIPQPTFKKLLHQRKRWAAKASVYKNPWSQLVAVIVLLMNLSLPVFTVLSMLGVFGFKWLLLGFAVKFNLDFFLIYTTAGFFKQQQLLRTYYLAAFIYPGFCCYVALSSFFGSYNWKGKTFKK
ncbi:glycosyltransferase family 2 protein [Neptunitalea lumnitzerae]|uniref:Glycosyl transferase n=1 Tax=Neptunitalea lumnitzerae TaxID=2965509 RepID=A0ABQ5MEU1_9FLAO|nr:glycosyltransferase [Neptunitalea sp. Y10]GLB47901.1 glycosyl transferase [Neptunitalea sp. Y10]